jgi:hypothetical protein
MTTATATSDSRLPTPDPLGQRPDECAISTSDVHYLRHCVARAAHKLIDEPAESE